jgi:hypothetical protein
LLEKETSEVPWLIKLFICLSMRIDWFARSSSWIFLQGPINHNQSFPTIKVAKNRWANEKKSYQNCDYCDFREPASKFVIYLSIHSFMIVKEAPHNHQYSADHL